MYNLYIGNKNYSSWSLRPWVLMTAKAIPFTEHLIPFHDKAAWAEYKKLAPNGLVPTLRDGDALVWDSLAIAEYLAERHLGIWPEDGRARAFARSAAAEMHSGFSRLRNICGMNVGIRVTLHKARMAELGPDLDRINTLWRDGLETFGGPFLAGKDFTAADAFFCPVAFRIQSFGLKLGTDAMTYARCLLDQPAMQDWYRAGLAETFRDPPHDAEIDEAGAITQDLRAPAKM